MRLTTTMCAVAVPSSTTRSAAASPAGLRTDGEDSVDSSGLAPDTIGLEVE
jgi:hypothetical protein